MSNTFNKGVVKAQRKMAKVTDNIATKTTLNAKHKEILSKIEDEQMQLPELQSRQTLLQQELEQLLVADLKLLTPTQIAHISEVKEELLLLDKKIKNVSRSKINYLLRNGELIFNYNDMDNSQILDKTAHTKIKKVSASSVFKKKKVVIESPISYYSGKTKGDCLKHFLSNVDPNFVFYKESNITDDNYCEQCQCFRVLKSNEATMVCPQCGSELCVIMESDKPSLKDPPPETRHYEYKRFNHFCDWLAKIQGKESSEVPSEVIDTILLEIKRERIKDLSDVDEENIRRYLKKHSDKNYDKYFNHVAQILFKINGIPPLSMTPERERDYRLMFLMIQEPYELYCPETRSNFSSYSYIIYKFSQLLNHPEIMNKMHLLKSKEKLYALDVIWRQICTHLGGANKGWKFIKSY